MIQAPDMCASTVRRSAGRCRRDDVATVLARLLRDARSARQILYLSSGDRAIDQALNEALESSD